MLTFIFASICFAIIAKIVWYTIKYNWISRRIKNNIPRLRSQYPIISQMFFHKDAYERVHREYFDENDVPHKVVRGVKLRTYRWF